MRCVRAPKTRYLVTSLKVSEMFLCLKLLVSLVETQSFKR